MKLGRLTTNVKSLQRAADEMNVLMKAALLTLLAALLATAGCASATREPASTASSSQARGASSVTAGTAIPFLPEWSSPSIERDTPPPVAARIRREQQSLVTLFQEASHSPRSRVVGCETNQFGSLGPPAPTVTPRILGHHVEVVFRYLRNPSSAACRPFTFDVVVYSGRKSSPTFNNAGAIGHFRVTGPRGRVVVSIPWQGRAPYHLIATSTAVTGSRGPAVELPLECPGTGDGTRGCLRGYEPEAHSLPMPRPVLPIRGVSPATLEASLRYVIARERWPNATAARCRSLQVCDVTFADPVYRNVPFRVRYRIAGQQVVGCWLAWREKLLDTRPYEDAGGGRLFFAGCVDWPR